MDDGAIERAKERIAQRADTAAIDALLEQARTKLEALVAAADEATAGLPERVDDAVQNGLRDQVAPVARNLAEIRGLMNQLIRRLERLEGDSAADRHARVDDLALLVDLVSSGWKSVDDRIGSLERSFQTGEGAIVYRIEERRTGT